MELKDLDTELLIEELQDRGYIRVLWHRRDIEQTAENLGISLNEDDISFLIDDLESNHDASYGLNWDIITDRIFDINNNKEKYKQYGKV